MNKYRFTTNRNSTKHIEAESVEITSNGDLLFWSEWEPIDAGQRRRIIHAVASGVWHHVILVN